MSPNTSPKFDVDTGTRPSDLNTRLSHAAALLDCYIVVTDAPANRYVAVAVDAFFVTQRPDAVLPADPVRARWQRVATTVSRARRTLKVSL
jgi:hypothetical protein